MADVARFVDLVRRVNITVNKTSPDGAWEAITRDPWIKSGKYALGWVYFCVILLVCAAGVHIYHLLCDMIRIALFYKENTEASRTNLAEQYNGQYGQYVGQYEQYPGQYGQQGQYGAEHMIGNGQSFPVNPDINSGEPGNKETDTPLSPDRLSPPLQADPSNHDDSRFRPASTAGTNTTSTDNLDSFAGSIQPINVLIAFFRMIFYRPMPELPVPFAGRSVALPSLAIVLLTIAATAFTFCYSFIPQPLFWQDISFGSPPLAVRAGMLSVSLIPWIVALSMKANFISVITGIGHERLNVMHRWLAYLCLGLAIVHMVPFLITPIDSTSESRFTFRKLIDRNGNMYVYGTGIAALVPLGFLCLHSLPILRRRAYEFFVVCHVPVAALFIGMMFWHCNNFLTSWDYLIATVTIWGASLLYRLAFLNWTRPGSLSWMVGDESAITLLPENAIKVTVPTRMKWRPGQYVYLRMPAISIVESHPFTVASLCSDDFPSDYGEGYHDMLLVFRPFSGFTSNVLDTALQNGPWQTYRAFIDGPYGGMRRRIEAFDTVVLIAGGSGITAIVSQLLYLIKRMRDGKASTKKVVVIWALRRPETFEWFKEELRICREFAPPGSVSCRFFITAAPTGTTPFQSPVDGPLDQYPFGGAGPANQSGHDQQQLHHPTTGRPLTDYIHGTVDGTLQSIAQKRLSAISQQRSNRNSNVEAGFDDELRRENEDAIMPLPQNGGPGGGGGGAAGGVTYAQQPWAVRRQSAGVGIATSTGLTPESAMTQQQQQQPSSTATGAGALPGPRQVATGPGHGRKISLDIDAAISAGETALDPHSAVSDVAPSATSTATFGLGAARHNGSTGAGAGGVDAVGPAGQAFGRDVPIQDGSDGQRERQVQENEKGQGQGPAPAPATGTKNIDGRTPTDFQKRFMRFAFLSPATTALPKSDLPRAAKSNSGGGDATQELKQESTTTATDAAGERPSLSVFPLWKSKPRHDDPEIRTSSPATATPSHAGNHHNLGAIASSSTTGGGEGTGAIPQSTTTDPSSTPTASWSVQLGRPDLNHILRTSAPSWGRRTCVFVCGPPPMRIGVSAEVARLQAMVVLGKVPKGCGLANDVVLTEKKAEVYLHTENYAL